MRNDHEIFLSEQDIKEGVVSLAEKLDNLVDSCDKVCIIGILNGCVPFLSDLIQNMKRKDVLVDTIGISSYEGQEQKMPQISKLPSVKDLEGYTIVLVDDIIDSGNTMSFVKDNILQQIYGIKSPIEICIIKRGELQITQHAICTTESKYWFYGYGMDLDGRDRGLREIRLINPPQ